MRRGWAIADERENSAGVYYTLTMRTQGTLEATVTVKRSKHGKYVCLTHLTADQCEHSQFVKQHVEESATV